MNTYCNYCRCAVDARIEVREETFNIKGDLITSTARVAVCPICGNDLYMPELEHENDNLAYNQYRKIHGLLMPDQIKSIREKYGLSQVAFAKLLGFGEKTITRYEGGSIQDDAPNNLMLLIDEECNFRMILKRNRQRLNEIECGRVEAALRKLSTCSRFYYQPNSDYIFESTHATLCFQPREAVAQ